MLFQIQSYINFLLKSSNQHGIHSPFVYKLITNCFYDKSTKKWYLKASNFRENLLDDDTIISIQDFGAGSKKLQNNQRKVSKIAKNAGITYKRALLLGRLINYFEVENILEIGTSLGIATSSMNFANPKSNIITLEGCSNTAYVAENSFKKFGIKNINIKTGNFKDTLPAALKNKIFDCIFFDGNHQKNPTIDYFEQCMHHIHNDSIFIFDDIYWSKGMKEAWNQIKNHPKVTVSIDTFYWGIVFFRKEQPKQHFTIRL